MRLLKPSPGKKLITTSNYLEMLFNKNLEGVLARLTPFDLGCSFFNSQH
jgi:hypothetical protein